MRDPNLTHGQRGLVIMKDDVILGGIWVGVGGNPSGQRDDVSIAGPGSDELVMSRVQLW